MHRGLLAGAVAALLAPAAIAQQAPTAATAATETLEEVVVTGSRIARPELQSSTPVTIVSAMDIQATGNLNTADVLRNLPGVGVSGISSSNSNFSTSSSGVNTVNLRNLGDSRTLVLINGRRMVPGVAGTSAADFNMIPTDFIERVDVITGGASAVYGSDAVAGVVNVVLLERFNGIRVRAQGGGATEGGENTRLGSLTAGSDFADGRGNAFLNLSYDKSSGLYSRQRAISTTDTSVSYPGIYGAYSSFVPAGNVALADANLNIVDGLYTFNSANQVVPYSTPLGFNRDAWRRISIPTDRTLVSAVLKYDVAEKQKFYTEFTYGQTHTQSDIEPFPLGVGPMGTTDNVYNGAGGIPVTNAYIPADLAAIIAADNADPTITGGCSTGVTADCIANLGVRKRLTGVAIRSSDARRQTSRIVTGFKGDLFGTPWNYDVYYMYGRTTDNQLSTGQVNVLNLRYALDSVVDPNTGEIVCRDAIAQSQGCVPINMFGATSITPQAAAYINSPATREVVIQQQVMSAIAQGPVFKLPAGEVRAVVGFEHRTEDSSENWDSLTNSGLNGGNALPNVAGSFTVNEVFGEVAVPLLADVTAVKDLGLEAAVRSSDYTTVGRVSTWNLRLNYAPIEDLRFRAAYAKAVRAPNIGELYSAPAQTFPTGITDPCDDVTATTTGAVATACRAIPAIANTLAAGNPFHYSFLDYQSITGFNGGNIKLGPETAKTATFGLVFTPTALRNFTTTIDYFDIKIDDAVNTLDYPTLLTQCLLTGSPALCGSVYRNPTTGKLTRVDLELINVSTLRTTGIDLQSHYRLPLGSSVGGALDFALNWSHVLKWEQTGAPGLPTVDFLGQIPNSSTGASGAPKDRASLTVRYSGHSFEAGWTMHYLGSMKDQIDPANVSPAQEPFNNVGAVTYHDLDLRYVFDGKWKTSLYGGVRNLFDKKPPFMPTGMSSQITGTETAPDLYDAIGRQWYLGVEVQL